MSGLEMAAGAIGITDVALKSIKGLYDVIQAYKEVPDKIKGFKSEIASLQNNLAGLKFLEIADEPTREEVTKTGVADAINSCGKACDEFKKKLDVWTKRGDDSFRDKVIIVRNRSSVQKYTAKIWTTARLLDSAIGILTLQKTTNIEALTKQLHQWRVDAQAERDQNAEDIASIDEDDDAEIELSGKDEILESFLSRIEEIRSRVTTGKLIQNIRNVQTGEDARVQIGESEAGAEKVDRQEIQDIITEKKGMVQIGVFGGKGVFD